jgi:hypothetical protein
MLCRISASESSNTPLCIPLKVYSTGLQDTDSKIRIHILNLPRQILTYKQLTVMTMN